MLELLASTFFATAALFFVVDPIGLVPLFVAMTQDHTAEQRRATAKKACLIFVGVTTFFAVGGGFLFDLLGVSLAAFKIAGGLLLLYTAADMLQSKQPGTRTSTEEMDAAALREDIAIVPLAMPLLAGPGAIATAMVLSSRASNPWERLPVVVAILLIAGITFLALRAAPMIDRVLGKSGQSILERVMGLLLATIAVQFVVDGLGEALPGLTQGLSL